MCKHLGVQTPGKYYEHAPDEVFIIANGRITIMWEIPVNDQTQLGNCPDIMLHEDDQKWSTGCGKAVIVRALRAINKGSENYLQILPGQLSGSKAQKIALIDSRDILCRVLG